jgi:eukaryotic-like serine/threonine-protein kinase
MALHAGTRLGTYEIVSPLGAGGMGEVFRAHDTNLGRDVAVKVLPANMANDAERMARFQREAQVLASLNHPNIAAIYGMEESGATRALVMELVEGPTLAQRIAGQGPAPAGAALVDDALPIAKQIADALEYAHERGIIHRDLKPANIKITPEGTVKVLDFGLAKALDPGAASSPSGTPAPQDSPTLTAAATQAGVIIGTAAYMSPEQARGKAADRRADIWAFGCVVYEMLAGKRPFRGETVTDVLASVVKTEPDWDELPGDTPARIGELIRRCLVKDRKQRVQAIGDARIAIEEVISGDAGTPHGATHPAASPATEGTRPRQRALPWVMLACLALLAGIAAGWWVGAGRTAPNPNWSGELLGGPRIAMGLRISPDGHTIAFQAMMNGLTQVAVMDTQSGDWTVLSKNRSHGFVTEISWSLDGSEIYFDREFSVPQGIYAVSIFGGDEHLILKGAKGPEVLPDGSLLVDRLNKDGNFQLYHFWPEGGRLEALGAFPYGDDLSPAVRAFHDGKDAVFFGTTGEQDKADNSLHLYILNLESGKSSRLAPQVSLNIPVNLPVFPLGIASDDRSVLVGQMAGDVHQIISIPRNGTGPVRTLLTLTLPSLYIDVAKNGDLYLNQLERPYEVLRFSASGGAPESLAGSENSDINAHAPFQLTDGRVMIGSIIAGRRKLLAAASGGELVPLIQTKEDVAFPACTVGKDEVAFLLGSPGHAAVALASVADGQIIRRFSEIPAGEVTSFAASPDGKTLYYAASGAVWAIPTSGGQPRSMAAGDSAAPDPNGKDLIVRVRNRDAIRLMRVPVSGGTGVPLPISSALRLPSVNLSPDAVGKDGRILVTVTSPDSWFYGVGVLDPRAGKIERIPLNFAGDVFAPGWLPDGRIIAAGLPTNVTMWRFHPTAGNAQ